MTGKISEFQEYIRKAVTPFHSVEAGISLLRQAGFEELTMTLSNHMIPCFLHLPSGRGRWERRRSILLLRTRIIHASI